MKKIQKHIEDQIKQHYDNVHVPDLPWSEIEKRVKWQNFKSFNLKTFNIYSLSIVVAVITISSILLFQQKFQDQPIKKNINTIEHKEVLIQPKEDELLKVVNKSDKSIKEQTNIQQENKQLPSTVKNIEPTIKKNNIENETSSLKDSISIDTIKIVEKKIVKKRMVIYKSKKNNDTTQTK